MTDAELITRWLDTKFKHRISPIKYDLFHKDLDLYYKKNDKTLDINDLDKLNELKEFGKFIKLNTPKYVNKYDKVYHKKLIMESNLVQTFNINRKKYNLFLDPRTPRFHVNMLFNKMIDYCKYNKICDHKGNTLINKSLRNKFTKFCYKKSKH